MVCFFVFPEVYNDFFCFLCVEDEVIVLTPCSQCLDLLPVSRFIIVGYESHYGRVVCEFDEGVGVVGWSAVVCEESRGLE